MAGPNQSDAIAELALCMLDLYKASGVARQRVGFGPDGLGRLARFSGQTEEAVAANLMDEVEPMGGQAVALCRAIRKAGAPAAALNGHGKTAAV